MSEPAAELPISDARDRLADVVSRAYYAGRITYVTRRGQRLAAVVPAELAEAIEQRATELGTTPNQLLSLVVSDAVGDLPRDDAEEDWRYR